MTCCLKVVSDEEMKKYDKYKQHVELIGIWSKGGSFANGNSIRKLQEM